MWHSYKHETGKTSKIRTKKHIIMECFFFFNYQLFRTAVYYFHCYSLIPVFVLTRT